MTVLPINPDKETAFEEIGWRAKETLAVDPPYDNSRRRNLGHAARKTSGYTIPVDADRDPFTNPDRPEYTDEQWAEFNQSAKVGSSLVKDTLRADKEAKAKAAEVPKVASPEELERRHQEIHDDWYDHELGIDDDTTLLDLSPNYQLWKRPDER